MASLGMKDKNYQELFAGDKVQIVNGANAGKALHKIRAAGRPYYIVGDLGTGTKAPVPVEISCKKVMRLTK
jgi:hypothetical protein